MSRSINVIKNGTFEPEYKQFFSENAVKVMG